MRSKIFGLAVVLAAATTAQAAVAQQGDYGQAQQDGRPAGRDGRGQFQRLLRGIDLTPQQRESIRTIFEQARSQRGGHGRGGGWGQDGQGGEPTPEERQQMEQRRAEMERHREEMVNRIRAILNDQQRAQFDRNLEDMQANRRDRRGNRDGNEPQQRR
jgi:Spy/CpxP family protein refolding chaperone